MSLAACLVKQAFFQFPHVGIAFVGIQLGAFFDDGCQFSGGGLAGGMSACEHYVHHHTHGVQIRASVGLGYAELLRCGIAGGADDAGVLLCIGFIFPRNIKIQQHHPSIIADHHVFRLDIPMVIAVAVQKAHALAHRRHHSPLAYPMLWGVCFGISIELYKKTNFNRSIYNLI